MYNYDLMSEEYKAAGEYLMELMRAALTLTKAQEKPEGISWEHVYKMSERHSVEAISAYGVDTLNNKPENGLYEKWQNKKILTQFKVLHFDIERESILAEMEEKGIDYLPLKGVLIAGYYPHAGMRSMADNDILYGFIENTGDEYRLRGKDKIEQENATKLAQEIMVEIMERRGYKTESLVGAHDSFFKKPFYNFEMHRKLMPSLSSHQSYYDNPWRKAVKDTENEHGYHFSNEDEYLYFLAHAFKHFDGGGCGIRLLSDIYAFMKKKGFMMDRCYIEKELENLNLVTFEKNIKTLVFAVFEEKRELFKEEKNLLYYLLGCGTYGRTDVYIMNKIQKYQNKDSGFSLKTRFIYISSRIFLDEEMIKEYFPFFYKRRYLRIFLPFYRLLRGLMIHPRIIIGEWKSIWKNNKK